MVRRVRRGLGEKSFLGWGDAVRGARTWGTYGDVYIAYTKTLDPLDLAKIDKKGSF